MGDASRKRGRDEVAPSADISPWEERLMDILDENGLALSPSAPPADVMALLRDAQQVRATR